jgi:hypothetical protein
VTPPGWIVSLFGLIARLRGDRDALDRERRRSIYLTAKTRPEPWQGGPVEGVDAQVYAEHGFIYRDPMRVVILLDNGLETGRSDERVIEADAHTGFYVPLVPHRSRDQTVRVSLRGRFGREITSTQLRL